MLLSMWALQALKKGHTVIWRSKDVDSWTIFAHRAPVNVIVPYDSYSFSIESRDGENIEMPENISVVRIPRPDDAAENLIHGAVNVICVNTSSPSSESAWWTIFADRLVHTAKGWTSFFFDEINDVFVSKPTGDQWVTQDRFKNVFASFRKKRIHFRASAHIFHDVDYNISYKFRYNIYLRGSVLLPKKRTALRYPALISQLDDFQGILDDAASFVVFDYEKMPYDVATGEVVSVDGPEWSLSRYPNLMFSLGILPTVKCVNPECNRPVRVREGQTTCPYCGNELILVDEAAPGTPPSVIKNGGEGGMSIDQKRHGNSGGMVGVSPQPPGPDLNILNTPNEDLPGQKQQDPPMFDPGTMAAEDLAANAFGLVMELAQDPEKMKALESDPELNAKFKQLMNTRIPAVDINRVAKKISNKRRLTMKVPELEAESMVLRNQAAEKRECANCGKKLEGNQLYYCSENCKAEFYVNHPTSVHWNEIRNQALARDNNSCVKCGKPAGEVDHIQEIWEGGPEFDLDNLQSLCHECHVAKTNENRSRRDGNKQK
ncbi:MAG: HNH endonuclease [Thermoplasmataceae archaeon]